MIYKSSSAGMIRKLLSWYLSDRQPTVRGIQGRVFQAKASGVIKVLRWDHAWCAPGTQSRSEQWNKESEVAQSYPTLRNSMDCRLPGSSDNSPWSFSGKSTGVGCHFLLQGIFPTQGLNLGLPHCRQRLYHLSHREAPTMEQWVYKCNKECVRTEFSNDITKTSVNIRK